MFNFIRYVVKPAVIAALIYVAGYLLGTIAGYFHERTVNKFA